MKTVLAKFKNLLKKCVKKINKNKQNCNLMMYTKVKNYSTNPIVKSKIGDWDNEYAKKFNIID